MSVHNGRTRIHEIRVENHYGDVSAVDIAWLCDLADEAIAVRDVARRGYGYGWRRFNDLELRTAKEARR